MKRIKYKEPRDKRFKTTKMTGLAEQIYFDDNIKINYRSSHFTLAHSRKITHLISPRIFTGSVFENQNYTAAVYFMLTGESFFPVGIGLRLR